MFLPMLLPMFLPMLLPMFLPGGFKRLADSASWAARARTVTTRCDGRLPCSTAASRATRHRANALQPRIDHAGRGVLRDQLLAAQAERRLAIQIEDARDPTR